jgi:hypothetical protein
VRYDMIVNAWLGLHLSARIAQRLSRGGTKWAFPVVLEKYICNTSFVYFAPMSRQ